MASVRGRGAGTVVLLIRHCSAGSREAWARDDGLRPLDRRGTAQAEALVGVAATVGADIRRVLSSPFLRCRQSVSPLAEALGVPLEIEPRLAEDTGDAATGMIRGLGPGGAVLCSHGDVLPLLLRRLAAEDGLPLGASPRCEKGSVWVLTGPSASRFFAARYLLPPV